MKSIFVMSALIVAMLATAGCNSGGSVNVSKSQATSSDVQVGGPIVGVTGGSGAPAPGDGPQASPTSTPSPAPSPSPSPAPSVTPPSGPTTDPGTVLIPPPRGSGIFIPIPELAKAVQVSTGKYHTCAVLADSQVRCWGRNNYGQLGDGTNSDSMTPVIVKGWLSDEPLSGVRSVVAGLSSTCALHNSGVVLCWGSNAAGQLGNDMTSDSSRPVMVAGLYGVTQMSGSASGFHYCATSAGAAKCWGHNVYGQLGNGNHETQRKPVQVFGLGSGVSEVTAGAYHSCALVNGYVRCWGYNAFGQLGDMSRDSKDTPSLTIVDRILWIAIPLADVRQVQAGAYHTCAVRQGGDALCWGSNSSHQLGDASADDSARPVQVVGVNAVGTLESVAALGVGSFHSCVNLTSGQARCWGANYFGQLGTNSFADSAVPEVVVGEKGTGSLSNVLSVSGGRGHTCAIVSGGTIRCWGDNGFGQLGTGNTKTRALPTLVGLYQ